MATKIEEVQVPVGKLKLGMYVARLDRPWLGTAFPLQGFAIDSIELIKELNTICQHVFVDVERTTDSSALAGLQLQRSISEPASNVTGIDLPPREVRPLKGSQRHFHEWRPAAKQSMAGALSAHNRVVYSDQTTTEQELKAARQTLDQFGRSMAGSFARIQKGGDLHTAEVDQAVDQVVNSLARNPDAMIWLARLGKSADYSYRHCINTSIWAVSLGRRLGLPQADLELLGRGSVYCDLGKAKLPAALLDRAGPLARWERAIVEQHVEFGLEIVAQADSNDPAIAAMVAQHHAPFDGSGYPNQLRGEDIDLYARIAAIADSFDAMINHKSYRRGISISAAVREIYRERGKRFQPELIEEFIQAIGVYPAGSLVELTDGSVGVVVGESRVRRLRPRVLLLLDRDKQPLIDPPVFDLLSIETSTEGEPLHIKNDLDPGSFDLDPAKYLL